MNKESDSEDFKHKKSLGQNFLTSNVVPSFMCDAGQITAGDLVLEIGPGTGALTRELLKRGAKVTAVETDERVIPILNTEFENEVKTGQLTIIYADIKTFDWGQVGFTTGKYKLIANIPYYLSGFLLRLFLESSNHPKTLVFLMQKELVERIARAKKESLLSLSVKVFGETKYTKTVGRGHFHPQPKVDSAILAVSSISHQNFKDPGDMERFFEILHLGFGQKRKQLIGNLSKHYERAKLESIFNHCELPLDIRAEDVSLAKWLILHQHINN